MSLGASGPPPSVTAAQQQQLNRDAILTSAQVNQIDQFTPFGSLTFQGEVGEPGRSSTITLSPEVQGIINSQLGLSQGLANQAQGRLDQLTTTPFDLGAAGGRRIDLDTTDRFGRPMIRRLEQRPLQGGFDDAGPIDRDVATTGGIERQNRDVDTSGIQRQLDFSQFGALPTASDFQAERQLVENALFNRQAGRITEQFDRDIDRRITELANQGITEFSNPVAFQEGLRPFLEARNDALENASLSAITGAGAEQSRLFGLTLGARQQGVGEVTSQGQFANLAQQQGVGQDLANRGLGIQQQQANNAARQQAFQQQLLAQQAANAAQQQQFAQNLAGSQFFNQAQNQRLAQDAAILQGDLAAGGFGNQARDAFINELILQRNQPFNELSAFLQGSPSAPTPNFMQQPAFQMQAADLVGLQASANQSAASRQAGLFGALGTLGGSLGSAAILAPALA